MKVNFLISLSILLGGILISSGTKAELSLSKDDSQVNFISVKNEHIAESHSFDDFTGTLSDEGKLQIDINLMSVNTLIPIRNERMQQMLFNVTDFALATFVADIDNSLTKMPLGTSKDVSIEGQLTIKDKTVQVTFLVNITSLENGNINATTIKPTIINTSEFGLDSGVDALQDIAMLKSISKSVPFTFSVTFK